MKTAFGILVALSLLATPALADCKDVPEPVAAYLRANPGWRMTTLDDQEAYIQQGWRQSHHDDCPGMAKVDLDGRGPLYALVLQKPAPGRTDGKVISQTILVGRRAGALWQHIIRKPGKPDIAVDPDLVFRFPPGTYKGIFNPGSKLALRHDGLFLGQWDSHSDIYYMRGNALRSFLYTD